MAQTTAKKGWVDYHGQEYDEKKYTLVQAMRNIFMEEDPEDAVWVLSEYLVPIVERE